MFACRPCEVRAIQAVFGKVGTQLLMPLLPLGPGFLLVLLGLESADYNYDQIRAVAAAAAATLGVLVVKWLRGRARYMREGFFSLHRRELAEQHDLRPRDLVSLDGILSS